MTNSLFFNSQHSPIGAFASFTLGERVAKGGLAVELGKPADQNIWVGLEKPEGGFACLPFFDAVADETRRYDVSGNGVQRGPLLQTFADAEISRGKSCRQSDVKRRLTNSPTVA